MYRCSQLCRARGFVCETCGKNDILFPWDFGLVTRCADCGSCYHKKCFDKLAACPRCPRIVAAFERAGDADGKGGRRKDSSAAVIVVRPSSSWRRVFITVYPALPVRSLDQTPVLAGLTRYIYYRSSSHRITLYVHVYNVYYCLLSELYIYIYFITVFIVPRISRGVVFNINDLYARSLFFYSFRRNGVRTSGAAPSPWKPRRFVLYRR